jgi:hypothetical protein
MNAKKSFSGLNLVTILLGPDERLFTIIKRLELAKLILTKSFDDNFGTLS